MYCWVVPQKNPVAQDSLQSENFKLGELEEGLAVSFPVEKYSFEKDFLAGGRKSMFLHHCDFILKVCMKTD